MTKRIGARLLTIGAFTLMTLSAAATTIDTFDFEQFGFMGLNSGTPTSPGLFGSFTGAVEPDGEIALADLTSFSLGEGGGIAFSLADLQLFSYFVTGGNGSLSVLANGGSTGAVPAQAVTCIGAPAALAPACNPPGTPPGDLGYESFAGFFLPNTPFAFSDSQPVITLVSSVTQTPPSTTPEPVSMALLGSALVGLAIVRIRSKQH